MVISFEEIDDFPEKKVAILTTGSQGEPMAALSRMAKQAHQHISFRKGDTVIIAASPIPGNEVSVSKIIDFYLDLVLRLFITVKKSSCFRSWKPRRIKADDKFNEAEIFYTRTW